eukprot:scaffold10961_cov75-Skeletonema_dohrnii-CCMP3373.AAC.3
MHLPLLCREQSSAAFGVSYVYGERAEANGAVHGREERMVDGYTSLYIWSSHFVSSLPLSFILISAD